MTRCSTCLPCYKTIVYPVIIIIHIASLNRFIAKKEMIHLVMMMPAHTMLQINIPLAIKR